MVRSTGMRVRGGSHISESKSSHLSLLLPRFKSLRRITWLTWDHGKRYLVRADIRSNIRGNYGCPCQTIRTTMNVLRKPRSRISLAPTSKRISVRISVPLWLVRIFERIVQMFVPRIYEHGVTGGYPYGYFGLISRDIRVDNTSSAVKNSSWLFKRISFAHSRRRLVSFRLFLPPHKKRVFSRDVRTLRTSMPIFFWIFTKNWVVPNFFLGIRVKSRIVLY